MCAMDTVNTEEKGGNAAIRGLICNSPSPMDCDSYNFPVNMSNTFENDYEVPATVPEARKRFSTGQSPVPEFGTGDVLDLSMNTTDLDLSMQSSYIMNTPTNERDSGEDYTPERTTSSSSQDTQPRLDSPLAPPRDTLFTPDIRSPAEAHTDSKALRVRRTLGGQMKSDSSLAHLGSRCTGRQTGSSVIRPTTTGSGRRTYRSTGTGSSPARKLTSTRKHQQQQKRGSKIRLEDLKLDGVTSKDITTIGKLFPGDTLQLGRDEFKEWQSQNRVRKLTVSEENALRKVRRRLLGRTYAKRSREKQLQNENDTETKIAELLKQNAAYKQSIRHLERLIAQAQC